jgi:hypothetical protein
MNAVISLCHFCELHGPSVLFVTQAFHEPHDPAAEPDDQQPKMCYGSASGRCRGLPTNMSVSCEVRVLSRCMLTKKSFLLYKFYHVCLYKDVLMPGHLAVECFAWMTSTFAMDAEVILITAIFIKWV